MNEREYAINDVTQSVVTSVSDLKKYAAGQVVRFSDFAEGQPFVARVKRPSIIALAKSGKIPNELLNTANEMFMKGMDKDADDKKLANVYGITEIICKATLISPSFEEIQDAGLELTDEQVIEIFNYSQMGVKALIPFSEQSENIELSGNGETI